MPPHAPVIAAAATMIPPSIVWTTCSKAASTFMSDSRTLSAALSSLVVISFLPRMKAALSSGRRFTRWLASSQNSLSRSTDRIGRNYIANFAMANHVSHAFALGSFGLKLNVAPLCWS